MPQLPPLLPQLPLWVTHACRVLRGGGALRLHVLRCGGCGLCAARGLMCGHALLLRQLLPAERAPHAVHVLALLARGPAAVVALHPPASPAGRATRAPIGLLAPLLPLLLPACAALVQARVAGQLPRRALTAAGWSARHGQLAAPARRAAAAALLLTLLLGVMPADAIRPRTQLPRCAQRWLPETAGERLPARPAQARLRHAGYLPHDAAAPATHLQHKVGQGMAHGTQVHISAQKGAS